MKKWMKYWYEGKNNEDLDQKKISETFFGSTGKKYDFLEGGGECRILEKKHPWKWIKKIWTEG